MAKSAVSYALNGKPGVSEETKSRILQVADEMGWRPSAVGRALSRMRVGAMGLALNRPPELLGPEPFYWELVSGMQEVLGPLDVTLAMQVVGGRDAELGLYRRWAARRAVDAVALTDVTHDDPRVGLLLELGIPAVILSPPFEGTAGSRAFGPADGPSTTPWLWTDGAEGMLMAFDHLASLGHRRIARVAGIAAYAHTIQRTRAMRAEAERLGLPSPTVVVTDYSQTMGIEATRALLDLDPRPTAIVYDNDIMAAAALQVTRELHIRVPQDLSVVAWDDSMITHLTAPRLTSVSVDVRGYGMRVAEALNSIARGVPVRSGAAADMVLEVRESTGAPPRDDA